MEPIPSTPKRVLRYEKLVEHFRRQVEAQILKPGDQLPSFAQMQAQHGIGQGTLEKVYSILEEENLVVRLPKRGTFVAEPRKRNILNVIGFAPALEPGLNDYYLQLLQGVQQAAFRLGVEVLLLHQNSQIRWEKVDGLIIAGQVPRFPSQMPAVSLIRAFEDVPSITIDEYGGTVAATRHLVELGHRKIAYLHTIETFPVDRFQPGLAKMRLKGYRDTLEEAGIRPSRQWTKPEREPWEWADRIGKEYEVIGYEKMVSWLADDWHSLGCTAILAHNDDMATGILRAFREHGIRVPEDVSVVGYDGSAVSRQVTPTLTTIDVPLREAGSRGLELLLEQIDASAHDRPYQPASEPIVLGTRLVTGQSTGRPPT